MNTQHTQDHSPLRRMLREAAQESASYSTSDTYRDIGRAADATLFTRLTTLFLINKGPILMTLSTAIAALGIGFALLQGQTTSNIAGDAQQPQTTTSGVTVTQSAVPAKGSHPVADSINNNARCSSRLTKDTLNISSQEKQGIQNLTVLVSPDADVKIVDFKATGNQLNLFGKEPIACDKARVDTVHSANMSSRTVRRSTMPSMDIQNKAALEADDFLAALGIQKKPNVIVFNDGSKFLQPGMHIDRYFSGSDYQMHLDVCKTLDSVIHDEDRPKVSFRPMFIVENTGRIVEFCDAAVNKTGQVNSSEERMLAYRDSCVTVVVHPNGKTPLYLLYYPTEEFLKALPREKALQVRAEQGNTEALKELQDSYRGCRYMSFCSTSNGAIEDTEILGSMSTDVKVKVSLREPRTMRVALYDIVGRLVAEIDRGTYYRAGQHIVPLTVGANSQQGATFYLLTITTDSGEKVSQRVVLGN